jgi:hypothetical protein
VRIYRYTCIDMKKFSMNLPEELHKQLKHWCVDNNTEMGEVIRRLIEYFLSEESKKAKQPRGESISDFHSHRHDR